MTRIVLLPILGILLIAAPRGVLGRLATVTDTGMEQLFAWEYEDVQLRAMVRDYRGHIYIGECFSFLYHCIVQFYCFITFSCIVPSCSAILCLVGIYFLWPDNWGYMQGKVSGIF